MRAGDYSPLFDMNLMMKDAGLGAELARAASMQAPMLERVLEVFAEARAAGYGGDDFSAVARLYEDRIGKHGKL